MKVNKFNLSKKNSLVLIIAIVIIIITIIIFPFLQNNNNEDNKTNNKSVEELNVQSRTESIQRFQTQFCGLDGQPQSNNYVSEVTLPSECSMPLGIYIDDDDEFGTSYPVAFDFDSNGNIYFVGIRIPSLWFGNTTEMENNSSNGIYEIPLPTDSFSEQEKAGLSLGSTFVQNKTVWVSMLSFGNKGQIVGYNIGTKNITKIFPLPSDLTSPVGITDDIEGNLWITDHGTSIFFKLNPNDGEIVKYATSQVVTILYGLLNGLKTRLDI